MNNRTLAAQLRLFIDKQSNIAGLWDGKLPGQAEDDAHTASDLIALAMPLLDSLSALIATTAHEEK